MTPLAHQASHVKADVCLEVASVERVLAQRQELAPLDGQIFAGDAEALLAFLIDVGVKDTILIEVDGHLELGGQVSSWAALKGHVEAYRGLLRIGGDLLLILDYILDILWRVRVHLIYLPLPGPLAKGVPT